MGGLREEESDLVNGSVVGAVTQHDGVVPTVRLLLSTAAAGGGGRALTQVMDQHTAATRAGGYYVPAVWVHSETRHVRHCRFAPGNDKGLNRSLRRHALVEEMTTLHTPYCHCVRRHIAHSMEHTTFLGTNDSDYTQLSCRTTVQRAILCTHGHFFTFAQEVHISQNTATHRFLMSKSQCLHADTTKRTTGTNEGDKEQNDEANLEEGQS